MKKLDVVEKIVDGLEDYDLLNSHYSREEASKLIFDVLKDYVLIKGEVLENG